MSSRLAASVLASALVFSACATRADIRTAPLYSPAPSTPIPAVTPSLAPTNTPGAVVMPRHPERSRRARVVRVVDGDTIVLSGIDVGQLDRRTGGHKARLIGIDTPEVYGGGECFGREASAFTHRALDGANVYVDHDIDPIDPYGRALVYVWTMDDELFNARIVAEGFALPMTVPPNVRHADLFFRLARDAREAKRGLWSRC